VSRRSLYIPLGLQRDGLEVCGRGSVLTGYYLEVDKVIRHIVVYRRVVCIGKGCVPVAFVEGVQKRSVESIGPS